MDKKETVLEAFLRQSNIDPNSFEQSEEYEKLIAEKEKAEAMKMFMKQTSGAFSNKSISDKVEIPTQIKSEDLNQKTDVSPQFRDYDHSLEQDRWKMIGGKTDDDGITMEEV
jgi:hypothetical protein